MAATDELTRQEGPAEQSQRVGQAILAAALSLPLFNAAIAETAPESAVISYKYLDYRDSQPGTDRINVKAHAWSIMVPFAGEWSLQAGYTKDTVSGASPQYWSTSSASMRDKREAKDISLTRYFAHDTLTAGVNLSDENDYTARGFSLSGTHSTEDKNTTFNYGFAVSNDDIDVESQALHKSKRKMDFALGVTQVLTQRDIVQLMFTDVNVKGYMSDPFKSFDIRPGSRHQNTAMLRWNHHFDATDGTLRLSYRYYKDSWEIKAHTATAEYVQPLGMGWTVTPSIRIHDQSAARFYVKDIAGLIDTFTSPGPYSLDQRLSAFGARTFGLKVSKTFDSNWTADVKYDKYMQKSGWRLFGDGSPDIAPFNAHMLQLGASYRF